MAKRLSLHLDANKILNKFKFGFRINHSTSLALIDVIDNVLEHLDNYKHVYLVLILTFKRHLILLITEF